MTLSFLAALTAPWASAAPVDLTLYTEVYPPFNYNNSGRLTGSSVEQLKLILAETGLSYTIEILPWARGYNLAEMEPSTCVFSTMITPRRAKRFKWVAPLYRETQVLARRQQDHAAPVTLAQARRSVVGVYINDVAAELAQSDGFEQIDTSPSMNTTVEKLLNGRVDFIYMAHSTVDRLREQGVAIETAVEAYHAVGGLACNAQTPDAVIAPLQSALDRMIADGRQAEILTRFGVSTTP
ncbi:hypothetical protein BJF92_06680 [Rhizobium rhizosphaerae]|uniref:Solute-binding protein family 3/N-terminal domain-containing protein n=1 Tax=Xaviernesmea rhizosphaerae TaxID=1672749 RepID=A0A1Q9APG6_9HYPH|nr:transporter substrate-binding domain-containing protein [Xaviernesmea rhizosphaerae]OLP57204.1 hypothetical protein BJF92_06680 [Xaviernesmea rhizosphaerae]